MIVTLAVVCGNPKPKSRTLEAALFVGQRLCGAPPDVVLDLVDLGPALLGWGDPTATAAVEAVRNCDVAIFASPTYKGTYTGLLKLFLDQFPSDSLAGTLAFPLMLGAAMGLLDVLGAPTDWIISSEASFRGANAGWFRSAMIWEGTMTMCVTLDRSTSSITRPASKRSRVGWMGSASTRKVTKPMEGRGKT